MNEPINPINPVRLEQPQATQSTPTDPKKLAALKAKLDTELPVAAIGENASDLGHDEVVISEMGKALCRFAQELGRDPQMRAAFLSSIPDSMQAEVLKEDGGASINYDAVLQICMALYGPEVLARADSYDRTRRRQIDRFDYYRALLAHFGLSYDDEAPDEHEGESLWDRFKKQLQHMFAPSEPPENTGSETEKAENGPAEKAESAPLPPKPKEKKEEKPPELPRLWP